MVEATHAMQSQILCTLFGDIVHSFGLSFSVTFKRHTEMLRFQLLQ